MKCNIPEISWHNREPVLSCDLYPLKNEFYRLATGGNDNFILIWQIKFDEKDSINVEVLSELNRHQKAVNVVRWSPNGQYLASGDDDGNIILWQLKTDNLPSLDDGPEFKETWIVHKVLRNHKDDVYDICWSPNSDKLLSGSVDNTAILWNLTRLKSEHIISDHKSFVQGVAWDPKNQYIATLSSDRICRVFEDNGRKIKAKIAKGQLPVQESHPLHGKEVKYFHDDTFKTYFRRLSFSPDGSFLVVPSGSVETEESKNVLYATYLFTMDCLNKPAAILPMPKQCSIAAKCSPVLYELRPNLEPIVDLKYRMIIAVATDSDVILYDTQQRAPFAHLNNIHYTRLTDLSWSHDGLLLIATSTDGFITLVTFEKNELGIPYVKKESEVEANLNVSGCEELEQPEEVSEKIEVKPKKPNFLVQWAKNSPKRKNCEIEEATKKIKTEDVPNGISVTKSENSSAHTNVNKLIPKRVKDVNVSKEDNESAASKEDSIVKKIVPKRITPITLQTKPEIIEILDSPEKIIPDQSKPVKRIVPITLSTSSPKRIKPIKIGDVDKTKKVDENSDDEVTLKIKKDHEETISNSEREKLQTDLINCKELNETEEKSTETSNKSKQVVEIDSSTNSGQKTSTKKLKSEEKIIQSTKNKSKNTTPNSKMSLLQFFKPISTSAEPKEKIAPIEIEDSDEEPSMKISAKSLFKKTKKKESVSNIISEESEPIIISEETGDIPDDFTLVVEETTTDSIVDENKVLEKENEVLVEQNKDEVKNEIKQPRRIPLITLSSPKIKKKKQEG